MYIGSVIHTMLSPNHEIACATPSRLQPTSYMLEYRVCGQAI